MVTGGAAGAQTHLELRAWETSPDSPVPCRVHLNNERGEPVITEAFPAWHDHFVFPGRATSPLAPGRYDDEVERGPEYRRLRGSICLSKHQTVPLDLRLERIVDLKTEGWRSGDLHIHRNPESVPLLARAEDLHFAPVITWWNGKNTWSARDLPNPRWVRFADQGFSDLLAGEDEREGGALLYIHLPRPLPIQNAGREFPSPMRFLEEAHRSFPEGHADIEKPFWWDVPVWLAGGMATPSAWPTITCAAAEAGE